MIWWVTSIIQCDDLWISWEHIDTLLSNIFWEFDFQGTLVLYLNFQPVGSLPFNQSPWKETTCHEINHVLPSSLQWLHISRRRSTLPETLEIPMMEWCEFRTLGKKTPYLFISKISGNDWLWVWLGGLGVPYNPIFFIRISKILRKEKSTLFTPTKICKSFSMVPPGWWSDHCRSSGAVVGNEAIKTRTLKLTARNSPWK